MASALERTGKFVSRHPRSITTAVVLALAGFGVTAFGIAPLAPDAADLPSRIVTETVTPEGITSQLEALAANELELYRNDLTRASDTADTLLRRLNVDDPHAAAFIRGDAVARKLVSGRAGKMVQVRTDASGELDFLVARYAAENSEQAGTHFTRLRISRVNGQFQAKVDTLPMASQIRMGSGTIRNSLFAATDDAHIPDPVANQLAEIFATDVDFHRELRRGDSFRVIYEALTADGEPITWSQSSGRVLAAEFTNNGKTFSAVWFKDPASGKGAYFDMNGQSKRRSFLASPLEFSRITSGFAMRMHPIQQTWKQHNGVDYGAPSGTPVRTVGDGTVEFAGWQNGYGNVVSIKHSNNRSTVYAHLSRIDVRRGQRVDQGLRIGAVGATGWATGPHLHFEVKLNGIHQNPLTIAKASETLTISPAGKVQFTQVAQGVRAQLDAAQTIAGSSMYAE
ncbi:M23 family peptidase [Albitalea terrae]|uniref:M23 family peptidase n=1 Tax=Piscinibacter terrae TaxID=2496871 RepID=A0A3N7HVT1_9BURK|nr:M23 family peptidase [Albitalea terrae]